MLTLLKRAGKDFIEDKAMSQAAAVAFFTALSFAPLVLLLITVGGMLGEQARADLLNFFERQIGPTASTVTATVVETESQNEGAGSWWRWAVGIGMLLFTASAVFAQLQASLNRIWDVEARPGQGVWGFVRTRLLSIGMIFAILFILLVALVVSATLEHLVPQGAGGLARAASVVVSFLVFTLLFACIFKFLPDVRLAWRHVWFGAAATAALFAIGQLVLGVYFDRVEVGSGYGEAAGSLIALLVWVYYSCIIFFFGAEVAQQRVMMSGERITPRAHARPVLERRTAPAA